MKKIIFIVSLFFTMCSVSSAQKLHFAKKTGEDANLFSSTNSFTVSEEGIFIALILDLNSRAKTEYVVFEFNKIQEDKSERVTGKEKKMRGDEKVCFWKRFRKDETGAYRVKVYDDKKQLLCSGDLILTGEELN